MGLPSRLCKSVGERKKEKEKKKTEGGEDYISHEATRRLAFAAAGGSCGASREL